MTLREVLNFWAFIMMLMAALGCVYVLNGMVKHDPITYGETLFIVASLSPTILMFVTGQGYGAAFFSGLIWGGGAKRGSPGRAWAARAPRACYGGTGWWGTSRG